LWRNDPRVEPFPLRGAFRRPGAQNTREKG
jgi:hypothetical protein